MAGISGLPNRRFQFFNWLSGLLWVGVVTGLGYALSMIPFVKTTKTGHDLPDGAADRPAGDWPRWYGYCGYQEEILQRLIHSPRMASKSPVTLPLTGATGAASLSNPCIVRIRAASSPGVIPK